MPERDFAEFLAGCRPAIEEAIDGLLPPSRAWPERLHEAMRYAVFAGGKRLRPALVLIGCEAFGGERPLALPGAAAVELIHTYSLVHDDLPALDDDDLRRGRATVHRQYDEATAILVGDALLTLGLDTLARHSAALPGAVRAEAVALVGRAIGSGGMIGGQFEDLADEKSWPADAQAAVERVHRGKTASLIAASLELGGLYAGATAGERRALAGFGDSLGRLFQASDDILDVVGDAGALGKTAGKDARAHKLTYPALLGVDESRRRLAALAEETQSRAASLPESGGLFRTLVERLATRDR